MKQNQFKTLLRHAVLAALPLASQVSCANNNPPDKPTNTESVEANATNDPCRAGETTRKTSQESFSAQVQLLSKPLSAEQCIALCEKEFEKARVGGFNELIKLESINASNCTTENRPFSILGMRGKTSTPSTLISCEVDYTALKSPYTCPRPMVGRVPNGLHWDHQGAVTQNGIGEYLAEMAAMETAAITAFQYLGRELAAYNAPTTLIARAHGAVLEEKRHAQMAGLLAAAYDADVAEVKVDDFHLRSLYDIALENAVEGCVNETFAAACGLWQSEHAQLEVFREVIQHITDEEMGHAALSWDIHAWIMPQLSQIEQQHIQAAQAKAVEKLVSDFKQEGDPILQRTFGLPTREQATRLFAQLQSSVWDSVKSLSYPLRASTSAI